MIAEELIERVEKICAESDGATFEVRYLARDRTTGGLPWTANLDTPQFAGYGEGNSLADAVECALTDWEDDEGEQSMNVRAKVGKGKTVSTNTVMTKEPAGSISVAFREIETVESIALGFRAAMFTLDDPETGKEIGKVLTGSGFGTDAIILEFKGRQALVKGRDLLRAWVETFDPAEAARLPR